MSIFVPLGITWPLKTDKQNNKPIEKLAKCLKKETLLYTGYPLSLWFKFKYCVNM